MPFAQLREVSPKRAPDVIPSIKQRGTINVDNHQLSLPLVLPDAPVEMRKYYHAMMA
jgi:hypothetical protein